MKKIIVGNWKMNPKTLEQAKVILKKTKDTLQKTENIDVVVCPPFTYLHISNKKKEESKDDKKSSLFLGAQDVYFEDSGSFTGEISPASLEDMGVEYVIVGHSERRSMGEGDDIVSKKAFSVLKNGMIPIICIGEREHDINGNFYEFIKEQLRISISSIDKKDIDKIIIAYEPVWAIGAKDSMNPETIREMYIFIKKVLSDLYGQQKSNKIKILYGGAVNTSNISLVLKDGGVDGVLVGRESINIDTLEDFILTADKGLIK